MARARDNFVDLVVECSYFRCIQLRPTVFKADKGSSGGSTTFELTSSSEQFTWTVHLAMDNEHCDQQMALSFGLLKCRLGWTHLRDIVPVTK